ARDARDARDDRGLARLDDPVSSAVESAPPSRTAPPVACLHGAQPRVPFSTARFHGGVARPRVEAAHSPRADRPASSPHPAAVGRRRVPPRASLCQNRVLSTSGNPLTNYLTSYFLLLTSQFSLLTSRKA